jgi:monothiol glutaredoxin
MPTEILSESEEALRQEIEADIKKYKVVIYMKGTLDRPECGFSSNVAKILKSYTTDIKAHNILTQPELRAFIKVYNNWPTIPQVFINGEFQGGNDVITQLHEDGDLKGLFEESK